MNAVLQNAIVLDSAGPTRRDVAIASAHDVDVVRDAHRVDLTGHVVVRALVNAHDHLQLNNIPPLVNSAKFDNSSEWIDAMAAHRERDDVAAAVDVPSEIRHWHGALKNLVAGVTTVVHHDPWQPVFDDADFPVDVIRTGWSHSLLLGTSANGAAPHYGPEVRSSFRATPDGMPWVIHLAEGTDAAAACELARLEAMGCLTAQTILVHGVGLTPRDIARVIDVGASVVWCPASNHELLGRTLQPRQLFEAGRLMLGTDSRLTGARDLLDEMQVAAANSDLSPRDLLELATIAPRRLLGLRDLGSDVFVIRAAGDPYAATLHARRADIRVVVRSGVPAIADPDFAEWFEACAIDVVAVTLDGAPKLLDRRYARADAMAIEPGLALA